MINELKEDRKTYVPIIAASDIVDRVFTSDYIGVRGANVSVDFCYGSINFKNIGENEYLCLSINDFLLRKLILSNNLVPENSEIIFINSRNLDYIKTL
jgi:hypothetical protein